MLHLRTVIVTTALLCVAAFGCAYDQNVTDDEADVAGPFESTEEAHSYVQDLVTAGPDAVQHQAVDVYDPEPQLRRNEGANCDFCSEGTVYRCCVRGPDGEEVCSPPSC